MESVEVRPAKDEFAKDDFSDRFARDAIGKLTEDAAEGELVDVTLPIDIDPTDDTARSSVSAQIS